MILDTNKNSIRGYIFSGIILSLIVVAGCSGPDEDTDKSSSGTPVMKASVESKTIEETVKAVGTLHAEKTVEVSPEIAGLVETIGFTEGDTAGKGSLLIQLEDDRLQHQLQAKKYALEEAKARLENARQTYERNQRLHGKDVISDQQFDDSKEAFESAKAQVGRIKSEIGEVRERLKDTQIRAPYTGHTGARQIDAGDYVQPGRRLVTLYKTDPLEVSFTVPERYVGRIRKGQTVKVTVASYPDREFKGSVFFVSPSVREQTRDLLVKAEIPNPDAQLKPGSFANVTLILETLEKRPVVPAESLVSTRDGYVVFTIENGTARRQSIEIGLRKPGQVEIRSGLQVGDVVVRSGHQSIADGTNVQIMDETNNGQD